MDRWTRTDGLCEHDSKTIYVSRGLDPEELDLVLVHEIAHAATRSGHGKKWEARMEMAAQRADKIERSDLAEAIRKEIATPTITADDIYHEVRDFVASYPDQDFEVMLNFVSEKYGCTVDDFLARYPKLRGVFNKARR